MPFLSQILSNLELPPACPVFLLVDFVIFESSISKTVQDRKIILAIAFLLSLLQWRMFILFLNDIRSLVSLCLRQSLDIY